MGHAFAPGPHHSSFALRCVSSQEDVVLSRCRSRIQTAMSSLHVVFACFRALPWNVCSALLLLYPCFHRSNSSAGSARECMHECVSMFVLSLLLPSTRQCAERV